ncbi:ATP-binding Cassette (ABC) Superfamily [Achlya hypogyna]|uniref:ATP-binding Cassette (ABC) Superfamily n=1 Tax=Achlya hypogyna TaxID=1202772 RepID=A0A1V9YBP4_ACHHY|nr:ATP-binding Cassette (ABC) Superfamily [Achlya hypogyna]
MTKSRPHVRTLVWKNALLMRKRPRKLAFELLFPVLLLILFGQLKKQAANIDVPAGWSDNMDAVFSQQPLTAPTYPLFEHMDDPRQAKFYATEGTLSGLLHRLAAKSHAEGHAMRELPWDEARACYTKLVLHGDVSLDPSSPYALPAECHGKVAPYKLAIVPDTSFTRSYFSAAVAHWYPRVRLSANTSDLTAIPSWAESVVFYPNESALEAYVSGPSYALDASSPKIYAAIVFASPPSDAAIGSVVSVSYTLRLNAALTSAPKTSAASINPRQHALIASTYQSYTQSGFLTLQTLVARFLACRPVWDGRAPGHCAQAESVATASPVLDERLLVQLQRDPDLLHLVAEHRGIAEAAVNMAAFPPSALEALLKPLRHAPQSYFGAATLAFPIRAYTASPFYSLVGPLVAYAVAGSYMNVLSGLLVALVAEKESKARELMKILGVADGALFLAWYLTYGALFAVLALLQTVSASLQLFPRASPLLLFVFFFLAGLSVLAFGFLLSALFSKAKTAAYVGVLVYLVCFIAGNAFALAPAAAKMAAGLLSPAAMSYGLAVLSAAEASTTGVSLATWRIAYDNLSFASVLGLLALDIALYTTLGVYLEKVVPKDYGVPEHWTFPLRMFLARPARRSLSLLADTEPLAGTNEEEVSVDLQQQCDDGDALEIHHLRKTFLDASGTDKVAVAGLNLTLYKNQITCLLGHNGAGKTTLISMLTGMLPPTSGDATMLRGLSLRDDLKAIRKFIGVCPQDNVLFDDLTVHEHVAFYGRLKGASASGVDRILVDVGLDEKRATSAKALSGGMKRKLALAIAFLGDSKIVYLDEPTSGMDPYSRRLCWDLVLARRHNRIVVLTTHSMDEADVLGDRIAILAEGELQCVGSALFLKTKFGAGYTLSLVKARSDVSAADTVVLVSKYVPQATLLSSAGAEVVFRLPLDSAASFPALFTALDARLEALNIAAYGISVTTLEEVFLQVSRRAMHKGEPPLPVGRAEPAQAWPPMAPWNRFRRQLRALVRKRYLAATRDRKAVAFAIAWPMVYFALGIALLQSNALVQNEPAVAVLDAVPRGAPAPFSCHADDGGWCTVVLSAPVFTGAVAEPLASVVAPVYPTSHPQVFGIEYADVDTNDTTGFCLRTAEVALERSREAQYGGFVVHGSLRDRVFGYNVLVNTTAVHAAAAFKGLLDQALVRFLAHNASLNVSVANHPLPLTAVSKAAFTTALSFSATMSFAIAIAYFSASLVPFLVAEKQATRNAKLQQLLAGASLPAFWLANWVWDAGLYSLPCTFGLWSVTASDLAPFTGVDCTSCAVHAFAAVVCLFVFAGLAAIGFSYVAAYFCTDAANAQSYILSCHVYLGVYLSLGSLILDGLPSTHALNETLLFIFRLSPLFCLSRGLNSLSLEALRPAVGGGRSAFDWDVAGWDIAYVVVETALYPAFALAMDYAQSFPVLRRIVASDPVVADAPFTVDHDVDAETQRVSAGAAVSDAVVLDSLRKVYRDGNVGLAALSVGLARGECFGFLGTNGAGKSTTMKVLTSELVASAGSAALLGHDIQRELCAVRQLIGYCPQFDALFDLLTVREHLELFAALKSVPEEHGAAVVTAMVARLGLGPFEATRAAALSGGTKRKLSVAIALLGEPPVLLLDEPTTGMDPVSRRFLWDVIADVSTRTKASTVFLTTHSMEECEALSTRVGIMVAGRLRCLGSIQHLKSRFGNGLLLHIKLTPVAAEDVAQMLATTPELPERALSRPELTAVCAALGRLERMQLVRDDHPTGYALADTFARGETARPAEFCAWWQREDRFDACFDRLKAAFGADAVAVVERHLDVCRLKLSAPSLGLAPAFAIAEAMKAAGDIHEYTVSQTTLEQIFNSMAAP